MKTMYNWYNWTKRNLSNIFGFVGIILTIYFGSIYVPSWNKENLNEKLNSAKRQSIQSIKELIYSDSIATIEEIKTIVYSKELEENVVIPYSFYEILTLAQNSFMEDKFLPFYKRKELINEIEHFKAILLPEVAQQDFKKAQDQSRKLNISNILSIIISLMAGLLGLISFPSLTDDFCNSLYFSDKQHRK